MTFFYFLAVKTLHFCCFLACGKAQAVMSLDLKLRMIQYKMPNTVPLSSPIIIHTGDDGKKGGFDCLQIPDAKTSNDVSLMDKDSKPGVVGAFCGFAGLGNIQDETKDATGFKQTICCKPKTV